MNSSTLFDKIWDQHVVSDLGGGWSLLHVDRHLLHDLNASGTLKVLRERGYRVRNPELTVATADHGISTARGRADDTNPPAAVLIRGMRTETAQAGIRFYDINEDGQGIVHVMGPELGFTQPGCLLVCGDSHTCTHGGMGALSFGIGRSEIVHVLATQTIYQQKPQRMRVRFEGALGAGVVAKDMILHLIGKIGAAGGTGFAVEYAGSAIRALPIEGRLTICNLSIELGAKFGMVAPDDVTFEYLAGRQFAPKGGTGTRRSHTGARCPPIPMRCSIGRLRSTWRRSPRRSPGAPVRRMSFPVDGHIPDPASAADADRRKAMTAALDYMGLSPPQPIAGTPIDWVFIGSCTNSRLSDLQAAAAVAKGRKVAPGVRAWVVPGSQKVKRAAEAEGLDRVFLQAGFEWREPGCSMCLAANGETVPRGQRSVSTSNRNFEGRQGPGARTHLASPAMAAAAAIAGCISDVRKLVA